MWPSRPCTYKTRRLRIRFGYYFGESHYRNVITPGGLRKIQDTTGLPRGVSCVQLSEPQNQRLRMPRACPVERQVSCFLATNVNLHGTSPWHHAAASDHRCSDERESRRDKPVASWCCFRSSV